MKMQVKEFAKITGVSVRTLHYYDEIGLLTPALTDEVTGYRYYDEGSLLRMQEILFYRELDFSLKSISAFLSSPNYDRTKALLEQKKLLTLKKERLERLIDSIDAAVKGENILKAFDNSEFEEYKAEARDKWKNTEAYKEYHAKTRNYSKKKWDSLTEKMDGVFAEFSVCMNSHENPDCAKVQDLVKVLQKHITENYYLCTNDILASLGQMYVSDERFKSNIDKHTDGTADYVSEAIKLYCKKL